jgi:2-oxoglutarate dehydrogenase complex dehydrogenase (E1) component-like enzyme
MAYTQRINSRDKDTPGTFREEQEKRYKRVKTESGVSEFVNIDNPKQKRYGITGEDDRVKLLKNKKGETYKG